MENKHPKKTGLLLFLFGLVLGKKGLPLFWHIFYLAIVGTMGYLLYVT